MSKHETRFQNLINVIDNGVAVYRAIENGDNFVFIDFNKAAEQIDDIKKEDVIGKKVTEVFPGIRAFGLLEVLRKVWLTGEIMHHPLTQYKDGRIEGYRENDVYKLPSGEIVAVYKDRTVQKQYEARLEASETKFRYLWNNSSDGLVLINKQDGSIVDCNEKFIQLTGRDKKTLTSMKIWEIRPKYLQQQARDKYVKIAELGEGGGIHLQFEHSSGEIIDIDFSSNTVEFNGKKYLQSRCIDLRESKIYERKLSAVFLHANELMFAENIDDIAEISLNIVNDAIGYQYSSFELVVEHELHTLSNRNMEFDEMVYPLDGKGITVRAVNQRRIQNIGNVREDPDFISGSIGVLSELAVPIYKVGEVVGVLNVESTEPNAFSSEDEKLLELLAVQVSMAFKKIEADTKQKKAYMELLEEQTKVKHAEELEAIKTRFISDATHEIRTPLTTIRGFTELLQIKLSLKEGSVEKRYLDTVMRNINRLETLTSDLLDIQRLEAGRINLTMGVCPILENLERIVDDISLLISSKDQRIKITSYIDEKYIFCDKNRVCQVFVNLITNASKFSPTNSVIEIKIFDTIENIIFKVIDQGIGISQEDLPKLFKPFPDIKKELEVESTGLGLSICKGIIELHGGKIWAESKGRGMGSTFSFTLPKKPSESTINEEKRIKLESQREVSCASFTY